MDKGHKNRSRGHRNSFIVLPMFCRLSIKDVRFSHTRDRSDDPSSPKVSCIGQVKRKNRITGFPAVTRTTSSHNHKKLVKMFSSKTIAPPIHSGVSSHASGGRRSGSKSCSSSREMIGASDLRVAYFKNHDRDDFGDPDCFDIGEMDPPMPVAPRGNVGVDEVNIWDRRFNGRAPLKSLQIDQIHLSKSRFIPPTTV